ncbi:MAG: hypothetical protein K8I03_00415 [Ignavibacteria bacterium]|nr:hypothetical protein [Ignavibacteria bacterium]
MFTVTTPHFVVNVVLKPEYAEHLIPNIKKFDIVYYIQREFKGGRPSDADEKDICKVQMLCNRGALGNIMSYLKEYYVKGFGAVCYYEEVNVPM